MGGGAEKAVKEKNKKKGAKAKWFRGSISVVFKPP